MPTILRVGGGGMNIDGGRFENDVGLLQRASRAADGQIDGGMRLVDAVDGRVARGGDELKQALAGDSEAIEVVSEVMAEAVEAEENLTEEKDPTAKELLKAYREKLNSLATAMLKLVAARKGKGVKSEAWDLGCGWKLTLIPGVKGKQDLTPPAEGKAK